MRVKTNSVLAIGFLVALSAHAQFFLASDNASNYLSWGSTASSASQPSAGYSPGSWTFDNTAGGNASENGSFLGSSAQVGQSSNINGANGNSFGLYANSGQIADAVIPFPAGSMDLYQGFTLQMQNNFVQSGGTIGFSLPNNFEFYFNGGDSLYYISWTASPVGGGHISYTNATIPFTTEPLTLTYTVSDYGNFDFSVSGGGSSYSTFSGGAIGTGPDGGTGPNGIRVFNSNAGSGSSQDLYFNNISFTQAPEPSALGFAGLSALSALLLVRRRK